MNINQFSQWLSQSFTEQESVRPLLMGILNITPDSFSDGGLFFNPQAALIKALALIEEGADIIDIGGESSRPGASVLPEKEELERVIPVIKEIRKRSDISLSIDTYKPKVIEAAIDAGASFINDITALSNPCSLALLAKLQVPVCLMHMQGTPQTMQNKPLYKNNVTEEIIVFFQKRIEKCIEAGVKGENLILDPGFGFGKTVTHNLSIVKNLTMLRKFNRPILLGVSRKSTIGAVLNKNVDNRLLGGIALTLYAVSQGATIIRTHDVGETKQALDMLAAIKQADK